MLVLLVGARGASASVVLMKADGDVRVGEARVAFSSSPTRTVAWEQLHLSEARGELAWLVAVPRGGWLEPADDHFFESLDEATAPVIAPAKALQCGMATETTALARGVPVRSISSAIAPLAPAAAIEKLTALGYVVDASTRASILSLDALGEDVAILIMPAGTRGMTRIARVIGAPTRAFPLSLMPPTRLLAFVFAQGRARFFGLPEAEVDSAKLTWASNKSNYSTLLDAAIASSAPGAVTVFAGADSVFVDQPAGTSTVASFLRRYLAGESSSPAIAECITRIAPLGFSSKTVAPTCAKSSSWMSGVTPPGCAVATGDQLSAGALACGALDDLAAAAGGHVPARMALTRLEGLASASPKGRALELLTLGSLPSYREAKAGPLCSDPGQQPTTPTAPQSPEPTGPASEPSPAPEPAQSSSGGCDGSVFLDSCSRSSSSGGGCGGDSSSGDGCGGDSSSGDSCSGSSDSADDGCSSSSGSSGACKGATDSADDGCRTARRTPRVRFSAVIYLLIAAAAIARRVGRRSRYADRPDSVKWETISSDARSRE
jgi:hypothetical protein